MITYKAMSNYVMRNIAGDHVLIKTLNTDVGSSSVLVFNDTGAFLWENLTERISLNQLVTLLANKYSIERVQAELDVKNFLEKCLAEGIVIEEGEG